MNMSINKRGPSGASIAHEVLMGKPIGFKFTYNDLHILVNIEEGRDISVGSIGGFLTLAARKGIIEKTGVMIGQSVQYKLVKKDIPYKFGVQGDGRKPGQTNDLFNREEKVVNDVTEEIKTIPDAKITTPIAKTLASLAIMVQELEERKEKSLADFSTIQILEELTKRIGNK